jgi:serine/threonine protein kinase
VAEPPKLTGTVRDRKPSARIARALASPAGVLVILPALVIAAGVTVLTLGRGATRETAETMARHQLIAQASTVEHDVAFALEQTEPVLATMKILADVAMPTPDALTRLRDAVLGRPGVYNATIAFPTGGMWGAYFDDDNKLRVLESQVGPTGSSRVNYDVRRGELVEIARQTTNYDARTRPYYLAAAEAKRRVWLPPRVFSASGKTGLTVTEPVYGQDQTLKAVISIDYDVAGLSAFLLEAPLEGAHTVMFTTEGTILAYSAGSPKAGPDKRLLRYTDYEDPALAALFTGDALAKARGSKQPFFLRLATTNGDYLVSIAIVSGERAGSAASSDWYLATLVPEDSLLGPMHRLDRTSIIASIVALAIALGVALLFSWNVVRMRRAVGAARAEARSAEERAKQLGSYRLVERLGLGGQGEVWRAEHQLLARRAAIKLVRSDLANDPDQAALVQERFRREAQTLASMKSRHTIELYDYGVTDDGTFFYVMELLDGFDLSQLVRTWGPLPAARVVSIMAQACGSLAEAHDAGLLHRDIKPANLVLSRAADEVDIVKVLDFGIVHRVNELTTQPPRAVTEVGGSKRLAISKAPRDAATALGTKPGVKADIPTSISGHAPVGRPPAMPADLATSVSGAKPLGRPPAMPSPAAELATSISGAAPLSRPPEMPAAKRELGSNGSRLTVDGSVIGTPGYIPPEQATSSPLDPRGDIYSLGCVAWFLLTGREVFAGETVEDILRAHVEAPVPALRPHIEGWLPVELEAVIVRCLGKEPADRPDARELAAALRAIEIPDAHAWTSAHAAAWWAEPRDVATAPTTAAATAGALLVAHHAPPMIAHHEPAARSEAQTMVARPSNPNIE